MSMPPSLKNLLTGRGTVTDLRAIPSFCTASEDVLRALFEEFSDSRLPLLVEATSNQVNQFGGYTGLTASAFVEYTHRLAHDCGFDARRLVLGGDHLGPNPWKHQTAYEAMGNACSLVASYAAAGFRKIHLDASMRCADDKQLDDAQIAERAARLCASSESAATSSPPFYVIGTEVPTPGGRGDSNGILTVSRTADIRATIETHREAFLRHGIEHAWERVIALVVQPGVEFGNHSVIEFDAERAAGLSVALEPYPGISFEAHSTDFQSPGSLAGLVESGVAFLKVGPALTFAFRETVVSLTHIESYLETPAERSMVLETVHDLMRAVPQYWQSYYRDTDEVAYEQLFSLSDRIRYYWAFPQVQTALQRLFENVEGAAHRWPLLHQYFPDVDLQSIQRSGRPLARELIRARVSHVVRRYLRACR